MNFVIANWKMNLSIAESLSLAKESRKLFAKTPAEIVVCPSFTSLPFVGKILNDSPVATGSQDVFWESAGAFTGEVSIEDIRALGAGYVIIGHSERREYLGEEDWMINRKIKAALAADPLCPVVCIGESKEDHEAGERDEVLARQFEAAFEGVELGRDQNAIIAYEPVWAIGTGETPTPEDIEYVHQMIRALLRRQFGNRADNLCAVLYGGSVDGRTAGTIARIPDVDGFLVGGASLKAREFYRIAQTMIE